MFSVHLIIQMALTCLERLIHGIPFFWNNRKHVEQGYLPTFCALASLPPFLLEASIPSPPPGWLAERRLIAAGFSHCVLRVYWRVLRTTASQNCVPWAFVLFSLLALPGFCFWSQCQVLEVSVGQDRHTPRKDLMRNNVLSGKDQLAY